jgi:RNA polymerase sigma-70 factor (ECF subfamily)
MNATLDSIPTRQSLLKRLKGLENQESWQEFFETYWNLIYTTATRSGLNDAEAQDVVQETVICVVRSMPKFDYDPKIGSFKAWLRKLTKWRILDHLRKRNASPAPMASFEADLSHLLEMPDESDLAFDSHWDEEWRRAIVDAAVTKTKLKVEEKQFQIFDLCALQGWPIEKVASTLKISRARVYVSKHRVGKVFEQELRSIDLETEI